MAKKTNVMDDMVEGVKSAAQAVGQLADEAMGFEPENKVYERIVPMPHADVYSELPFALVEKNGVASGTGGVPGKGRSIV